MLSERENMQHDVIVIGGGLTGLAAATYLARSGRNVTVFEKSEQLGGRARTHESEGFHFNLGPHALYQGGHAARVLKELGIEVEGRQPSQSGAFGFRRGKLHTLPAGFVSMVTTSLMNPAEKMEAMRVFNSIRGMDTSGLHSTSV